MREWMFAIALAAAATTAVALDTTTQPAKTSPPATCPSAPPAGETPTTATAPSDPAVLKILDGLEKAGEKYATIRADVEYTEVSPLLGDSETRTGWLAHQAQTKDSPAKIRIHFDTLRQEEGRPIRDKLDYAFDGEWATIAKHKTNHMMLIQFGPEDRGRLLKLGQGPLPPLPFGQKTQEVLKYFRATTRPVGPSEPKGTTYVKLDARPEHRKDLDYPELEMWIEPKTHLPVKIIGTGRNRNIHTVFLKDLKTDQELKDEVFNLPRAGWNVEIKPYRE